MTIHRSRPRISPLRLHFRLRLLAALGLAAALGLGLGARPGAAQGSPFGINIHSPKGADLANIMDKLQAAGITWANVGVIWPYVEGTQGTYDWSLYDPIVAAAKAHGINLVGSILYTPPWASAAGTWTGVPNTAAWVDFCTKAAARYKGSITYWQLWNEPNQAEFWSGTEQQYITGLLIPGADAIHAGNPAAKVGGPALAHLKSAGWYNWLTAVLAQAGGHLDFITHHAYDTDGNKNVTADLTGSTLFGGEPALWDVDPPSLREVLENAGYFGKLPFWLTETGWQSGAIGEAGQAGYYDGLLIDWFGGYKGQTWMAKIFFYEMEDPPDHSSTWGVLNADGTPKQAYATYQSYIAGYNAGGGGQTPPPQSGDNAKLVSQNLPLTIAAGETVTARLTFQNTGTSTWTAAANYKLGAVGDKDAFAAPRALLGAGQSIAPGQQVTFTFAFTAPAAPGAYTSTWQMLREGVAWFGDVLAQPVTVAAAPPAADRSLALLGQRFLVSVAWHDPNSGSAGYGVAVPDTDETGTFWFFNSAQADLVVKFVDGRAVNQHFWFFYGALSDVEYWVTATDLVRGTTATYYNPQGNLCGQADTSTFGTARSSGKAAAVGMGAGVGAGAGLSASATDDGAAGAAGVGGGAGGAGWMGGPSAAGALSVMGGSSAAGGPSLMVAPSLMGGSSVMVAPTVVRGRRAPGDAGGAAGAGEAAGAAQGPAPATAWRWIEVDVPQEAGAPGAAGAVGAVSAVGGTPAMSPAAAAACVASATDLCLLSGRFQVSVDWQTTAGSAGSGMADTSSDGSGTFSFFDPAAIDLVVKAIDGRSVTGKFWFFYGALTDVAYTITLTDTITGSSKQYHNAQGNICGVGDTNAID